MRPAQTDDLQTLLDMMTDFYAESGYVLDRTRTAQAFTALLADPRLGRVWIIEQGSARAGYIVVTFVFAMEYGGVTAVVDDFYVRAAARGVGLGTAALAEVRRACSELGLRAMRVEVGHDNTVARSVYRRVGFEVVDHQLMTLPLAHPSHVV
jgi:ribosomal protein S18 acetylase RimI-like enzyme